MKLNTKKMNKLLNPISWSAYLEIAAILTIAYYAYISWKYYRPEIDQFFARLKGETSEKESRAILQCHPEAVAERISEPSTAVPAPDRATGIANYKERLGAVRDLGVALADYIHEASGKPYAPATLIPKLKKLLNDYPDVAASHERDEINLLIVRECEKTGTALLSESEVDMWWSA